MHGRRALTAGAVRGSEAGPAQDQTRPLIETLMIFTLSIREFTTHNDLY